MASSGGVGSSRSVNGVDWLGREMLGMRLRDDDDDEDDHRSVTVRLTHTNCN